MLDNLTMIRPEFRTILLDQRGAAVILWSIFTAAVGIYLFIARSILANPKYAAGFAFGESLRVVLWALAAVDFGYLFWWKRQFLSNEALLTREKQSKLLRALEAHKGPVEQRAASVISTFVTRKVVAFAIIEALAVYGLVLAIVGAYKFDQYILSGLALALFACEFPLQKSFADLLQKIETSTKS